MLCESAFAGGASVGIGYAGTAAPTGGMIIQGNVGIGTAAPGFALDVSGTGRFTGAVTLDTQATDVSHAVRASRTLTAGGGLTGAGDLTADRTFAVGAGTCITVNADDVAVTANCTDATTLDSLDSTAFLRSNASDEFEAGNTLTITGTLDANGDVSFADTSIGFDGASTNFNLTGDLTVNTADLVVRKSSGNVGIGTTTPNNKLDIYSTTKSAIGFSGASGNTYKWTMGMDVTNGGRFAIASSTALGTTDRFVIDGSGNVGIGTTSPRALLHVHHTGTDVVNPEFVMSGPLGAVDAGHSIDFRTTSNNSYARVAGVTNSIGTAGELSFWTSTGLTTAATEKVRIQGSGNVGIGTTSPWRTLSVVGTLAVNGLSGGAAGDDDVCMNPTTFDITDANASTCIVSSIRYKNIVGTLKNALSKVMELNPVSFTYKEELDHSKVKGVEHIGLIAEEVLEVEPRLVGYEKDGVTPRTVRYEESVALLVAAMQELNGKVEEQQMQIELLQKQIFQLQGVYPSNRCIY